MFDQSAVVFQNVGKRYRLYPTRVDNVLDALGLGWAFPGRMRKCQEFWALRHIDLEMPRGARIGIVGRNGAGKTTLLKLMTGNVDPTEGSVQIHGTVQALLQTGSGMHPEFTGYENIEAALTYQGLSPQEIQEAVADIAAFTELGPHLGQPFKTYSSGMQARLAFATATMVKPDILIIDEVLGVGDGYFLAKSTERVQKLIDSGATVLLVSHAMDQVVRFCERALWIDRGRIVQQGPCLEVVKEYDRYLRLLDEKRIRANNARRFRHDPGPAPTETADSLTVRFHVRGRAGDRLDVSKAELLERDRSQDVLRIGGPQDGVRANSCFVAEDRGGWSEPVGERSQPFRSLTVAAGSVQGDAVFSLFLFDSLAEYGVAFEYRTLGSPQVLVEIVRNDKVLASAPVPSAPSWQQFKARVPAEETALAPAPETPASAASPLRLQRWPGMGGLRIETVAFLDELGHERAVFAHGGRLRVRVTFRATHPGTFPVVPSLTIYRRSDGTCVSQMIGAPGQLELAAGGKGEAMLDLDPLNLGNGAYVVSLALFQRLDLDNQDEPKRYDLLDRSFEFSVHGRPALYHAVFQHPGVWSVQRADSTVLARSA